MSNAKRIAIYIRIGNKEGNTLDIQKEQLIRYCETKEIKNYEFYIDNGYSGNDLERPALQKLIQDAIDGKLSTCIVYELSRLSRSTRGAMHIIYDILIPHGVNIISLIDNLDTSTALGKSIIECYLRFEIGRMKGKRGKVHVEK